MTREKKFRESESRQTDRVVSNSTEVYKRLINLTKKSNKHWSRFEWERERERGSMLIFVCEVSPVRLIGEN